MRPARPNLVSSATWSALLAALVAPTLVVACGEEGETPKCTPQKLYDITDPDASNDPAVVRARNDAIAEGCLTPAGNATSGTIQVPAGGSGGGGGGGGKGGSGGKGGKGGSGGSNAAAGAGGV